MADLTTDAAKALEGVTPGSKWRAEGQPDPHGTRYDCERAQLPKGAMTDDELANAVFMADRTDLDLIVWQTAAKERIRWLSRSLTAQTARTEAAEAKCATLQATLDQSIYGWGGRGRKGRGIAGPSGRPDRQAGSDAGGVGTAGSNGGTL